MSKKTMLLALTALGAAMFALPAVASAGTWNMTPAGLAFTTSTPAGAGLTWTTANNEVKCTSSTGSGSYNAGSNTEGTLQLKFHGCTSAGTACTGENAGEPSGTITTTAGLTFRNVRLEPEKETPVGITIKGVGAETHLMNFRCGFGLVTFKVTGTVIGEVEACGGPKTTFALNFTSASKGNQTWKQVTTTGTIEDLTGTVNGTPETTSWDSTMLMHFVQNATADC